MDSIVRLKQVNYWPIFVTRGRRRQDLVEGIAKFIERNPSFKKYSH
jgi:hypothetical protein